MPEPTPTPLTAEWLAEIEQGAWQCARSCHHVPELLTHIRAQADQIAAAVEALGRYGHHLAGCAGTSRWTKAQDCNCGILDALARLGGTQ